VSRPGRSRSACGAKVLTFSVARAEKYERGEEEAIPDSCGWTQEPGQARDGVATVGSAAVFGWIPSGYWGRRDEFVLRWGGRALRTVTRFVEVRPRPPCRRELVAFRRPNYPEWNPARHRGRSGRARRARACPWLPAFSGKSPGILSLPPRSYLSRAEATEESQDFCSAARFLHFACTASRRRFP